MTEIQRIKPWTKRLALYYNIKMGEVQPNSNDRRKQRERETEDSATGIQISACSLKAGSFSAVLDLIIFSGTRN